MSASIYTSPSRVRVKTWTLITNKKVFGGGALVQLYRTPTLCLMHIRCDDDYVLKISTCTGASCDVSHDINQVQDGVYFKNKV